MSRLSLSLLKRSNGTILQFFSTRLVSIQDAVVAATATTTTKATTKASTRAIATERTSYRKYESARQSIKHIKMNPIPIVNFAMYENENDYIYNHVHKRLEDRCSELGKKTLGKSLVELEELLETDRSANLSERIMKIRSVIELNLPTMSLEQIAILLNRMRNLDREVRKPIAPVIDRHMKVSLERNSSTYSSKANVDLLLYVADLLYENRIWSAFSDVLISYIADNEHDKLTMSDEQLLHLLFYINLKRDSGHILYKYEQQMIKLLDKASIEDLAIISLAYFKTKTTIRNPKLLAGIVTQLTKNLPTIDPKQPGYCSIIKSLRYSSKDLICRDEILDLISSLAKDSEHKTLFGSPYNAVHTVKLLEAYRIYEPQMLNMLRHLLFRDLTKFRIKDIQYALTSLSNFAYMDLKYDVDFWNDLDKLAEDLISETRQDRHYQSFHLVPILRALAIFGYYNDKLIRYLKFILSHEDAVQHMRGVLEFDKSVLMIHAACRIEGGNHCLQDVLPLLKQCSNAIDRRGNTGSLNHLKSIPRAGKQHNTELYLSIARSLAASEEMQSQQYRFNFQYTFPHQNYVDLVITRDRPEPGSFNPATLEPRPVLGNTKPCIIFAVKKTDFVDGEDRLGGYKQLMIRLLSKLGYAVIAVDLHNPNICHLAQRVEYILNNNCSK